MVANAWAVGAWSAGAWAAGPSASGIAACRRITDDKQRLACFDRESALQEQQPSTEGANPQNATAPTAATAASAPASAPSSAPPSPSVGTELTPEQRMGLPPERVLKLQASPKAPDLKELTAKVRAVSGDRGGRRYFTLENGQVWRQVELDPQFTVRPGDTVKITKALFGSYFMSVNSHMNTRVSRAQ